MQTKKILTFVVYSALLADSSIAETSPPIQEQVIVTGLKRDSSIGDIPAAISVYSAEFLDDFEINRFNHLSDFVPGLIVQDQGVTGNSFVIRGISSDDGAAQQSPRVSIFLNGIDVSRVPSSYFELYDIEQVDIARGPQATLFGSAAAIGAIAVTSKRPEQGFSANLHASVGNYSAEEVNGHINFGGNLVQGRLALFHSQRDGYVENIANNREALQGYDRFAVRASLRFTPSENLTVDLILNHERADDTATAFKSARFAPPGGSTDPQTFAALGGSPYSDAHFGRGLGIDREVDDANITAIWRMNDNTKLTLISGYREYAIEEVFDADGTIAPFGELFDVSKGSQLSHELRLNWIRDSFDTLIGINYFSEDAEQSISFSTEESIFLNCQGIFGDAVPCYTNEGVVPVLTPVVTSGAFNELPYRAEFLEGADNESLSAFIDIAAQLNTRWELQAGLRYTYEDRSSSYRADQPASVLTGDSFFGIVDTRGSDVSSGDSYDSWLPRFSVLFHGDTNNLYGTIAKGRRSNVLNVQSGLDASDNVIADTTSIPAEDIWNYEIGIKGTALRSQMDYNVAIFYQDYKNFQINRRDESARVIVENAGTATNTGIETEARWAVSEFLQLNGHLAYIDASVDESSNNGLYAGNRFRLQPQWTVSLGYSYLSAIGNNLQFFSNGVWTYRSSVFFEPDNAPVLGIAIEQSSVALVNIKLGIKAPQQGWSLYFYGQNIFDKEYIIDAGNTGSVFGSPTYVSGEPALYGIGLTMNWKE